jgi:hypothetical protein
MFGRRAKGDHKSAEQAEPTATMDRGRTDDDGDVTRSHDTNDDTRDDTRVADTRAHDDTHVATAPHETEPVPAAAVPARDRFGGLDLGASLAGALAGLGSTLLLGAIVAGTIVLEIRYGVEVDNEGATIGALIAASVAVVLSFMVAGWVAGRMARYSGARNGLLAGVWLMLMGGVVPAFIVWINRSYDPFAEVARPDWLTEKAPAGGIIAAAAVAALSLVCAWFGGIAGARYHRRADDALVSEVRAEDGAIDLRDSTVDRRSVSRDRVRA